MTTTYTYEEVLSYLDSAGYDIKNNDGTVNFFLFGEMARNEGFYAKEDEEEVIFYK